MDRVFFALGCVSAFLGVVLGAFAAHFLKSHLDPHYLAIFETGVRYQIVHALALLAAAWAYTRWPGHAVCAGGWLFATGMLLFSGSLYVLALSGVKAWGAVTPFGGVAWLVGWLCLAWAPFARRG